MKKLSDYNKYNSNKKIGLSCFKRTIQTKSISNADYMGLFSNDKPDTIIDFCNESCVGMRNITYVKMLTNGKIHFVIASNNYNLTNIAKKLEDVRAHKYRII